MIDFPTLAPRANNGLDYTDDGDSTLLGPERAVRPTYRQAPGLEGRCIAGRYLVRELIGEGAFGRVYRAEPANHGRSGCHRSVAIKVIGPLGSRDRDLVRQFHAEIAAARRLHHRNVVSTFDHGHTDDGLFYLVMEHIPGRTLERVLVEDGALAMDQAVDLTVQILRAIDAIHAAGVVHADLKSANIMIQKRDSGYLAKIIDFSIARHLDDSAHHSAVWGKNHRIAGTPQYMAPEVASGHTPMKASDLYAAGVLLYQLLTGALPFSGNSVQLMLQHMEEPVIRPSERFAELDIPPALEDIVLRALAKDPDDRFSTAAEFTRALVAVRRNLVPAAPASSRLHCTATNAARIRLPRGAGQALRRFAGRVARVRPCATGKHMHAFTRLRHAVFVPVTRGYRDVTGRAGPNLLARYFLLRDGA